MTGKIKIFLVVIVILAIVALAIGIGASIGKKQGRVEAEQKLSPLVELVFPKPPDEIRSLGGTVKGIYGATINLEVYDPNDYLPHTDGTPRAKEMRFASISASTKYIFMDFTKLDKEGTPQTTAIKLSDLKTGDVITVKSDQNIKNAEKFDVTEVQLIKY